MVVSRARRVCAGIVIVCGVVAVGASAQEWTAQPAPTQARVWVQNRGQSEAVPVMVVPSAAPLPVQVGGTVLVATPPGGHVQTRASRQVWEYRGVNVTAGQDPVAGPDRGRPGRVGNHRPGVSGGRAHRRRDETSALKADGGPGAEPVRRYGFPTTTCADRTSGARR
jgi:hypothetical protein